MTVRGGEGKEDGERGDSMEGGRERIGRTCNVLFLRPTTASSSVPCGVLGGKKVEETSDG